MSASSQEVQALADAILELLGIRIRAGSLVIHFADYRVQKVDTNLAHPLVKRRLSETDESISDYLSR